MDPNKMIEIQHQMRQNNAELQEFLQDLNNWEIDIKRQDENLRSMQPGHVEENLPPVRNSLEKKRKKKPPKKKLEVHKIGSKDEKPVKKNTNYDYYSRWDKFDVDKALCDIDKEEESEQSYSEDSETEVDADGSEYDSSQYCGSACHFLDGSHMTRIYSSI